MLLPWSEIDTALLDMDGTLLDLHFDNYFWLEYLPQCYCEAYKIPYEQAKELIAQEYQKTQGTLQWYCVDYWTEQLGLPIMQLKQSIADRIQWRENAELFLERINKLKKTVILITNAHPASLALKMSKVNLAPWFDAIVSSHEFGYPKEYQAFWKHLQSQINFNPERTLFIDDSLAVLKSAEKYNIKYICTLSQADSKKEPMSKEQEGECGFNVIRDYAKCFKCEK